MLIVFWRYRWCNIIQSISCKRRLKRSWIKIIKSKNKIKIVICPGKVREVSTLNYKVLQKLYKTTEKLKKKSSKLLCTKDITIKYAL